MICVGFWYFSAFVVLECRHHKAKTLNEYLLICFKGSPEKQGSHRPGRLLEFDLGRGKLLKFENSAICPGIVLEFCKIALENVKSSLKIIKYINSFRFFWIYVMRERKLCENRWIR